MYAKDWLNNAHALMHTIEESQMENVKKAATIMADSIQAGRWVHTWGCGHATIPCEEMYPRIGGIVGFHPLCELPLTFFTQIIGQMGIHQFLYLERQEGYAQQIMKNYDFSDKDCLWIFSHTGINAVNIDMANEAHKPPLQWQEPVSVRRRRSRLLRALARRIGHHPAPVRQDRSPVNTRLCVAGVDDRVHCCRDPRGAWCEALHQPVAQRARRHHGTAAPRRRYRRVQEASQGTLSPHHDPGIVHLHRVRRTQCHDCNNRPTLNQLFVY